MWMASNIVACSKLELWCSFSLSFKLCPVFPIYTYYSYHKKLHSLLPSSTGQVLILHLHQKLSEAIARLEDHPYTQPFTSPFNLFAYAFDIWQEEELHTGGSRPLSGMGVVHVKSLMVLGYASRMCWCLHK